MQVKDVYNDITKRAPVVKENDPISTVVDKMIEDPLTRAVYVLNDGEELVGIISVNDVLDFLGQEYDNSVPSMIHNTFAKKASDLMSRPVSVSLEMPIEKALEIAVERHLEEIPVCDGKKVIGDVMCFEIIKALGGENK